MVVLLFRQHLDLYLDPVFYLELFSGLLIVNAGYYFTRQLSKDGFSFKDAAHIAGMIGMLGLIFTPGLFFYKNGHVVDICLTSIQYRILSGYMVFMVGAILWECRLIIAREPQKKNQMSGVQWGILLFASLAALFNLVLPSLGIGTPDDLLYGYVGSLFLSLGFVYAMIKHQLMNFPVPINQKVSAWISGIGLALLGLACVGAYAQIWGVQKGVHLLWMGISVSLVLYIFCFKPLRRFLLTASEKSFLKGQFQPDKLLQEWTDYLPTVPTVQEGVFAFARSLVFHMELKYAWIWTPKEDGLVEWTSWEWTQGHTLKKVPKPDVLLNQIPSSILSGLSEITQINKWTESHLVLPDTPCIVVPIAQFQNETAWIVLGPKLTQLPFYESDLGYIKALNDQLNSMFEKHLALKLAQDLAHNAALSQLTLGIAHEVRNPMGAIRLHVEQVKAAIQKGDMEAVQNSLKFIDHSLTRVLNTSEAMMKYGLSSSEITLKPTHILPIIDYLATLFKPVCFSKKINLKTHFDSNIPPVLADEIRLQQALINLITNAIQALEKVSEKHEKNINISISTNTFQNNTGKWVEGVSISIEDNGLGIEPRYLEKVFDPFFSIQGQSQDSIVNLGLGLSIVRDCIKAHRGKIVVSSDLKIGTKFTVLLEVLIK